MAIRIAVALIVRDEEHTLPRALNSVAGYADEIIVVDTGSVDDSRQVAATCGATVLTHPWTDDFSEARNVSLEAADADWTLVIDADEWVVDGQSAFADLRSLPPPMSGHIGLVTLLNSFELGGHLEQNAERVPRFLPRGTRYVGRVHERPAPIKNRWLSGLILGHDGYEPARRDLKTGRNERLLRRSLIDNPFDPYLHYQLGKDLEIQSRFPEAVEQYMKAHEFTISEIWGHDLDVRTIHCLTRSGDFVGGLEHAGDALSRWPQSSDVAFAAGNLMFEIACQHPRHSQATLEGARDLWSRCLALGDSAHLSGSVRGRGSHLAAHNLSLVHEALGDPILAQQLRETSNRLRSAIT